MKPEKDCFWIGSPPCDSPTDKRRPEISLQSTETDGKPDDQLICCGYVPVVKSGAQVRWSAWLGCVRDFCEAIWKGFCPPPRKRLELRFLSYPEADKLIRETNGAWTIAKEEDSNRCIGWVYLELLEEYPRFDKQPNAGDERRT